MENAPPQLTDQIISKYEKNKDFIEGENVYRKGA
jgi:hypothetical protein